MSWYSALILHESRIKGVSKHEPSLEYSVLLVRADSSEAAWERAKAIGKERETEYLNDLGETVSWEFLRVVEVDDLLVESVSDGTEVFGWIVERQPDREGDVEFPHGAD